MLVVMGVGLGLEGWRRDALVGRVVGARPHSVQESRVFSTSSSSSQQQRVNRHHEQHRRGPGECLRLWAAHLLRWPPVSSLLRPCRNKGPVGDWPDRWSAKAGILGSFEVSSWTPKTRCAWNVAGLRCVFDASSERLALGKGNPFKNFDTRLEALDARCMLRKRLARTLQISNPAVCMQGLTVSQ